MKNLFSRLSVLFLIPLFSLSVAGRAQETDYLRHRKNFDLCSYKRECSNCVGCGKQRYQVKINNKEDKAITKISYVFYSDVYNKILTKVAEIKGTKVDAKQIGLLYVCIPNGTHWAITELEYADGSKNNYVVKERLENFVQEPDECDCND